MAAGVITPELYIRLVEHQLMSYRCSQPALQAVLVAISTMGERGAYPSRRYGWDVSREKSSEWRCSAL
jgi:hypothetical protein